MDLNVMRYVLAVAQQGKFSLAAQVCHVGQPALSQQIARLEAELGVTLFHRSSKGATLTEAGTEFVRRAQKIVQQADALESEMALYAGLHRGTLNIGIITSLECIDFGNMLSAFCEKYPEISINIMQGGTHRLESLLIERKIDLAFMNKPQGQLDRSLCFCKLGQDAYHLAVASNHPLAKKKCISLIEAKNERFIFHHPEQAAAQICLEACRRAGFEPNIVCRSGNPTTGLYMVQGGLGVALLPSEEFRSHAVEGVTEITLADKIIKEVGIAWRADTSSSLIESAVEFVKSRK